MCDLDVFGVAKFFIGKSLEQNTSLSNNKLTDLLWQANGFWLALTDRPLFSESFRYSEHGVLLLPIIDNNYQIIMRTVPTDRDSKNKYSEKHYVFLNKIWRMFGGLPEDFLRHLSNKIPKLNKSNNYKKIDIKVISEYFKNELKNYGIGV